MLHPSPIAGASASISYHFCKLKQFHAQCSPLLDHRQSREQDGCSHGFLSQEFAKAQEAAFQTQNSTGKQVQIRWLEATRALPNTTEHRAQKHWSNNRHKTGKLKMTTWPKGVGTHFVFVHAIPNNKTLVLFWISVPYNYNPQLSKQNVTSEVRWLPALYLDSLHVFRYKLLNRTFKEIDWQTLLPEQHKNHKK